MIRLLYARHGYTVVDGNYQEGNPTGNISGIIVSLLIQKLEFSV